MAALFAAPLPVLAQQPNRRNRRLAANSKTVARHGHEPGSHRAGYAACGDQHRRGPSGQTHREQSGGHSELRADDQGRRRRRRSCGQRLHQGPALRRSISVHAARIRRHSGVQLVRPQLVRVRRLLPQRPGHRAPGVRARRRLEPVRAGLGRRPHQLHQQDRHRHARSEGAARIRRRRSRARRLLR